MSPTVALLNWDWIARNTDYLAGQTVEHIVFTVQAVVLGLAISFPLALLARRYDRLYQPMLQVTGVLFTIPSIAFFVLLIPFVGLSRVNVIIALTIYTLLILLRNIVEGLGAVPRDVLEAADAMGFSRTRRLFRAEVPLAMPVIIAGLRIATVSTIGLVTISAFIGFGGLGDVILRQGFNRGQFVTPIVVGLVLTTILSVAGDLSLVGLQRLATPWRRDR